MSSPPPQSSEPAPASVRRRFRGLTLGKVLAEGLRPPPDLSTPGSDVLPWQPPSPSEVAALIGDEYQILRLAGRGGMGAVYEVRHRALDRRAALKIVPPQIADSPGFAARFRHEARLTARLEHDGIVSVFDSGETVDGYLWYAMEFVEGEDLAARLRRGPCDPAEAVAILTGVAAALECAHAAGILHRDIKPANILLPASGGVKLGDFGLALTFDQGHDRFTRVGSTVGTMEYSAPEQLARAASTGPAADIYSLGVVAYELFTGELPRGIFDPPSVRNPAVDPAFDGVILRSLQNDPARRFQTVREFSAALQFAATRHERQEAEQRRTRRRLARRARIATALAAISLALGGAALYSWRASNEASTQRTAAQKAEAETDDIIRFLLTDLRRSLERTGNLSAMEAAMERAVKHYRQRHEQNSRSPESARHLAEVLTIKAGVIGNRGLFKEGDALFTEALDALLSARSQEPGNPVATEAVLQAWLDRTQFRMTAGRQKDALADARQLLGEADASQKSAPSPAHRRWQAVAWRAIGHALAYTGPFEEARTVYDNASRTFRELSAADPGNVTLSYDAAAMDMSLGSLEEAREHYPEMLAHFTAWHDYVQRHYSREDLMFSHSAFRMGVGLIKSNRPSEAIPYLKDAVRLAEKFAAASPGEKGYLNHLAFCLRTLAQAFQDSGDAAAAEAPRLREAEVTRQLRAPVKGAGR